MWFSQPYFWWGGLFPLLFLILMLVMYFMFARGVWLPFRCPWHSGQSAESPMDIVKKRYARGEITKQEFEQLRQDLSEPPEPGSHKLEK